MKLVRQPWLTASLALSIGLAPAGPVQAAQNSQPQQYIVEILVFANNNPDDQGEQWPANPGMPDVNAARQLGAPGGPTLLPPSDYQLSGVAADLERSGQYQPVLHLAWHQTATPLHNPGLGVHIEGPASSDTVNGTVTLSAGNYLHLNVDLVYRPAGAADAGSTPPPPATPAVVPTPSQPGSTTSAGTANAPGANPVSAAPAQATGTTQTHADQAVATPTWVSNPGAFRLDQQRRLHQGKMEYFDQPHFAVLALVTPYTPPPAADTSPTSNADGNGTASDSAAPQGGQ